MSVLKINIVLFGIDEVGSALIKQVIKSQKKILEERNIDLRFPIITNSTLAFFEKQDSKNQWEYKSINPVIPFRIEDLIEYAYDKELENLIAVDATLSQDFAKNYKLLIQNGIDVLTVNETLITIQDNQGGKEVIGSNILTQILEIAEKLKMREAV